jgi:hypothetical protein
MRCALAVVLACSTSSEPPPKPTSHDEPQRSWETIVVTDCGFTIEMPGRVTKTIVGATIRYASDGTSKLVVTCTTYPGEPPKVEASYRRLDNGHWLEGHRMRKGHQIHELTGDVTAEDDAGEMSRALASYKVY